MRLVCRTGVRLFEEAKKVPNSTARKVARGSRTTGHEAIAIAVCDLLNGFFTNYEFQRTYTIHGRSDEMQVFGDE
jgi:hypothetical protein